jgi:hypothetical protein
MSNFKDITVQFDSAVRASGNQWKASSVYVCEAENNHEYVMEAWFPTKEQAEHFISSISSNLGRA